MRDRKSVNNLSDLHTLIPGTSPPERIPDSIKNPLFALISLQVLFEKSGRKGSGVTIVRGFHHNTADLLRFAKELKTLCGAGGTVKNGEVEIQGDHRPKVAAYLEKQGFKVKVRT